MVPLLEHEVACPARPDPLSSSSNFDTPSIVALSITHKSSDISPNHALFYTTIRKSSPHTSCTSHSPNTHKSHKTSSAAAPDSRAQLEQRCTTTAVRSVKPPSKPETVQQERGMPADADRLDQWLGGTRSAAQVARRSWPYLSRHL